MHIAIILPRWVGDVVMATPMIQAVRQHFGHNAKLTAVVKPLIDYFGDELTIDWVTKPNLKDLFK